MEKLDTQAKTSEPKLISAGRVIGWTQPYFSSALCVGHSELSMAEFQAEFNSPFSREMPKLIGKEGAA